MRREEQDALIFILVNEMRQLEEAAERVRLVVKELGKRAGVKWELTGGLGRPSTTRQG
jgi:hypothetical protein